MASSVRVVNEGAIRKLHRLPDAMAGEFERRLGRAALFGKRSVETRLPSSRRLRGVGTRGARVGVRYDVKGRGMRATALIRATGPLHLLDNPTKPHRIEPRMRGRRSRGASKRAILVNGEPKAYANHPGTRGKKTFVRGIQQAEPLMRRELKAAPKAALGKVFR